MSPCGTSPGIEDNCCAIRTTDCVPGPIGILPHRRPILHRTTAATRRGPSAAESVRVTEHQFFFMCPSYQSHSLRRTDWIARRFPRLARPPRGGWPSGPSALAPSGHPAYGGNGLQAPTANRSPHAQLLPLRLSPPPSVCPVLLARNCPVLLAPRQFPFILLTRPHP